MLEELVLPDASRLHFESYAIEGETLLFTLTTTRTEAICPYCGTRSQRVNDRYRRKPADLPCFGYEVRLDLIIRRFFCENQDCRRATFAERLPTVIAPYARRTNRLAELQRNVAYEVGGELGERLFMLLKMNISADTVLRLIRGIEDNTVHTPRVLSVDDWALSKGQTYGTILVDLELQQVIDLLPDRSAEVLSTWLKAHPGVEIISRDRGNDYIKGATEGAPNAVQVADRWHLLKNLKDALIRLLERKIACLRTIAEKMGLSQPAPKDRLDASTDDEVPQLTLAEQDKQARRAKRRTRYEQVMQLHNQGFSNRQIVRHLGMGPRTVAKYIAADSCPMYPQGRKRPSKLDPYLPYLHERWEAGHRNASQLWREIRQLEFSGSRGLVAIWAAEQRKSMGLNPVRKTILPRTHQRSLSPSQAVWLFLKTKDNLSLDEQDMLQKLVEADAQLAQAYTLAQGFGRMVRERRAASLNSWFDAVARSDVSPLKRFANHLLQDLAAVIAGLSLPWSQGQTEGQVNRLKLIKRQMYGRANFDLLRKRVLPMPSPAPS
jgi:transposase